MRYNEIKNVDLQAKRLSFEKRSCENFMPERAVQRRQNAKDREKPDATNMNRPQAMLSFVVKSINSAKIQ